MSFSYTVHLTDDETKALSWLAARHETAAILWAYEEDNVITLPEYEAWRYLEEMVKENGNPNQVIPTCAGGSLASKLIDLWESIV